MADDSESEQNVETHVDKPYDEVFAVDADEVASVCTPSPHPDQQRDRDSLTGSFSHAQISRGNTPPKPDEMSDQDSDGDFDTGQADKKDELDEGEEEEDQLGQKVAGRPGPLAGGRPPGGQLYNEDGEEDEEDSGSSEDDDDDDDDDDEASGGAVEGIGSDHTIIVPPSIPVRAYDPQDYEHLPVTPEIKELFQYITRYTTQTIELEHKLKPFIPDFIPAVGDIDAFIKIQRPDEKPDTLGLTVLDEPCARQSDPTVLDLQLRAVSKQTNLKAVVVKSIDDAEKNSKQIDNWVSSISEIHRSRPPPNVHYQKNMPDIDTLMQEWPGDFEELLKEVGLPSAEIDCDLATYVDMICAILDIPIYKNKTQSLHVLFTLYSEFKNSQHFKSLAKSNALDNSKQSVAMKGHDNLVL